ncbi:heavy-metal-associated domain-containing protein [Halolactibacillus alkaliphilus]|nr:cation transporter [Halolactibacillus alkaliphilus]SFO66309.1 Copper chaperone CopZ [Halolactibacillus alkaliphilus]
MMLITLKLEQLGCPSCVKKIESGIKQQAGVHAVEVLFNSSKVKVDFNEKEVSRETIASVIEKLGYTVKNR